MPIHPRPIGVTVGKENPNDLAYAAPSSHSQPLFMQVQTGMSAGLSHAPRPAFVRIALRMLASAPMRPACNLVSGMTRGCSIWP